MIDKRRRDILEEQRSEHAIYVWVFLNEKITLYSEIKPSKDLFPESVINLCSSVIEFYFFLGCKYEIFMT